MKGNWIRILHHTINVHSWVLSYSNIYECSHGPLTEERTKGWLEIYSPAHVAIREIVLDESLRNNGTFYLNCRSVFLYLLIKFWNLLAKLVLMQFFLITQAQQNLKIFWILWMHTPPSYILIVHKDAGIDLLPWTITTISTETFLLRNMAQFS